MISKVVHYTNFNFGRQLGLPLKRTKMLKIIVEVLFRFHGNWFMSGCISANFAKKQLKMPQVLKLVKVSELLIKLWNLQVRFSVLCNFQINNFHMGGLARY